MEKLNVSWQATAEALEESTGRDAWDPKPGEATAGRVIRIDENASVYGTTLIEIECEDGSRVPIFLKTVLQREFTKKKVTLGDVIVVKYFGMKTPIKNGGKDYHSYTLDVFERKSDNNPSAEFADDIPL